MNHPRVALGLDRLRSLSVESCLSRIEKDNDRIRAVLTPLAKDAIREDARRRAEGGGPLAGVPYTLKDVWDTAALRTTGGSFRHRERVPSISCAVFETIDATGAVLVGKSNLSDLSFSTETNNHILGPCRNPYDPERTPGGSSGGAAAAVASGMAAFDWGTDFGGSIRLPAAYCGLVGVRLSASLWPVEAQHFPRIHPTFYPYCGMGPIARTVAEAEALIATLGELKTGAPARPRSFDKVRLVAPTGSHVGEWPTFAEDAEAALRKVGKHFERDRTLPPSRVLEWAFDFYVASHFDSFMTSEEMSIREGLASVALSLSTWGRADKRIHPNTAILLLLGAAGGLALSRFRARSEALLLRLQTQFDRIWEGGALVVTPTSTLPPPRHGRAAFTPGHAGFCKFGNLIDATCAAVPFGAFDSGLPRSIQILGPPGSEGAVLDLASQLEAYARSTLRSPSRKTPAR